MIKSLTAVTSLIDSNNKPYTNMYRHGCWIAGCLHNFAKVLLAFGAHHLKIFISNLFDMSELINVSKEVEICATYVF